MKESLLRYGVPLLVVMTLAAACPAGERVVERQRQVSKQTSNRGFFAGVRDRIQDRQRQRFSDRHQQNFRLEINGHRGAQNLRLENSRRNRGELVLRVDADHHDHAGEVQRFFLRNNGHGRTVERQVVRTYVERQELDACDDKQSFRLELNDGECRAFFKSH